MIDARFIEAKRRAAKYFLAIPIYANFVETPATVPEDVIFNEVEIEPQDHQCPLPKIRLRILYPTKVSTLHRTQVLEEEIFVLGHHLKLNLSNQLDQ